MAEKKVKQPKEKTYYALKSKKCRVSVIKKVNGEIQYKMTQSGAPIYDNKTGEQIPIMQTIDFDIVVERKGLDSYCMKKTSDPDLIETLDAKVKEGASPITSQETFEKQENPKAFLVNQQLKLAKGTIKEQNDKVVGLETVNENQANEIEDLKAKIKELKKK